MKKRISVPDGRKAHWPVNGGLEGILNGSPAGRPIGTPSGSSAGSQRVRGLAAVLSCMLLAFSQLVSAEILLSTEDGSITIRGDLLKFEDDQYTIRSVLGTIVIDAGTVNCEGEECPEIDPLDQIIRVAGPAYLLARLMPELVADYAMLNRSRSRVLALDDEVPAADSADGSLQSIEVTRNEDRLATFQLLSRQRSDAFADLLNGDIEVVISDQRISDEQLDQFIEAGLGDLTFEGRESIIAIDGMVPLLAPDNPIMDLSWNQLLGILSGRIENWAQVGGPDAGINLYLPSPDHAFAEEFEQRFMEPESIGFAAGARRLAVLEEIEERVADDRFGLALGSAATVENAKVPQIRSVCGLPIRHSSFALKSEDSLLARRVYIYTTNRENQPSRAVPFARGASYTSSHSGLDSSGLIDLRPVLSSLDGKGSQFLYALAEPELRGELDNLQAFAQTVLDAERLSITFRFDVGSSQLDNKAIEDATRLIELLDEKRFSDREFLLVGFTDSLGGSSVNRSLSAQRAEQIIEVMRSLSNDSPALRRVSATGYGEAFPVACNSSESERQLNRRVEVWVK